MGFMPTTGQAGNKFVQTGYEITGPLRGQEETLRAAVAAMKSRDMARIEADIEKLTAARQKKFEEIQKAAAARAAETVRGIETDLSDIELEKPLTDSELAILEDYNETFHKLTVKYQAASIEFYTAEILKMEQACEPLEKSLADARSEVSRIEEEIKKIQFQRKQIKGLLDQHQRTTHIYMPVIDRQKSREKQRQLGVR